jgi:UDP-N-acetylmuramate dehydrogenase
MRDRGSGIGDWSRQIAALQSNLQRPTSNIQLDAPLARYTTARLGGPAEALLEVTSAVELTDSVIAARQAGLPILILGGGANVLVSDAGVRGLTIINKAKRIEFRDNGVVWCEAGTVLPTLARECGARGLGGLEWAVGVPGTVGGAVVGNAGAHGRDIAADLISATILNANNEVIEWSNAELNFGYRTSRIKLEVRSQKSEIVVLAATFQLTPGDPAELEARAAEFNDYRRRTQPPGASLGSMFKNPPSSAAGRLIDQCGLKGTRRGEAEISTVHANFFVNRGEATAADVKALIDLARAQVRDRFGIELELEIELVGEW